MAPSRFKRSRRPMARRTRKARPTKISKAVKSYVKKAIHRNEENKVFINYAANQSITTAGAGSNPTAINLVPLPVQGNTQNTRIGNTIKVVKGFVRGHVNLLPYSSTVNPNVGPCYVKMWLCSNKTINTTAISGTNCSNDFFELGGSTTGFQGNMLDMELTNNRDNWTIYKTKTFELGTTSNDTLIGQVQSRIASDNSRFTRPFYFSFGRHMRKQIKFNDTQLAPTNINMFLLFQVVYADGSSTAITPAEYHYTSRVEYEDA